MQVYISVDMEGVAGVDQTRRTGHDYEPETVRRDGVTCAYAAPDAATLMRVLRAWMLLASPTLV